MTPPLLRKAHRLSIEDWEQRMAALLKELALPESFTFSGQIHQGGLRSFDVSLKIK